MALIYDIDFKDQNIDYINKVNKIYNKVFKDIIF